MSYTYYGVEPYTGNIIQHYGIEGQKWGTRRWQYPDGRFNEAGKERYFGKDSKYDFKSNKKMVKTKTETEFKINLPLNLGGISHKIIKENPDKFTSKKQKDFDYALKKIWTDKNFYNSYGVDAKYTKEFEKWFDGDNSKINKAIEKGYAKKFEKDFNKKYKKSDYNNYMDYYNDYIKAVSVGALLNLGVKPNKSNIEAMDNYLKTM